MSWIGLVPVVLTVLVVGGFWTVVIVSDADDTRNQAWNLVCYAIFVVLLIATFIMIMNPVGIESPFSTINRSLTGV